MRINSPKALLTATLLLIAFAAFPFMLGAAQEQAAQASSAGQVPLAVRVWDGKKFVPDLKLEDFEVTVNGQARPVSSLFLVDKSSVTRREGTANVLPDTSRRFYFLFQLFEYNPKIGDGIRDFFKEGFLPGDSLSIQTPMRNYVLGATALMSKPRDALAKEMIEIVRRDITEGGMAYKSILRELRRIVMSIGSANPMAQTNVEEGGSSMEQLGLENLLMQYREPLARMDALRRIDEDKIVQFAQSLRSVPGQKIVFFVYQREFNPELSPTVLNALIDSNQDNQNVLSGIHELFQTYHRNISLDPERIGHSFAASGVDFNLLFINKEPDRMAGITMREQSEDVFKIFAKTAQMTGGIVDNTQDPGIAIRDALKASERYYLLYFAAPAGAAAGSFQGLTVTIKGKEYKVLSRQGYQVD
jgi:hypothetical protein